MRRTAEFDAFGPYIYEVRTVADLPRLYRDAGIDPAAHRLVLKVPRTIERRHADPDMHLYDFLLAVDDTAVTVLRRRDDWYDRAYLPGTQIVAIEDSVALLDGRLILRAASGAATEVTYNAVDPAPMRRMIRLIRELYLPPRTTPPAPREPVTLGREDVALVTAYELLLDAEPGLRLLGATGREVVGSAFGRQVRGLPLLRPVTLHAAISLADDRELHLLHRRERLTRGGTKVHSIARTVLPRAGITGVRTRPHDAYPAVTIVTLSSEDAALDVPLRAGPATEALLAAL
ncbi:hypothetical protein [Symbioplanes lichenis]|uniref:hypothetical protein n=1 Tax=Symbioplanes lichenis TaxID=1629072 RepID=UPI0027393A62|nr:hypothetical protein [Actinoplanes lichenis]